VKGEKRDAGETKKKANLKFKASRQGNKFGGGQKKKGGGTLGNAACVTKKRLPRGKSKGWGQGGGKAGQKVWGKTAPKNKGKRVDKELQGGGQGGGRPRRHWTVKNRGPAQREKKTQGITNWGMCPTKKTKKKATRAKQKS